VNVVEKEREPRADVQRALRRRTEKQESE